MSFASANSRVGMGVRSEISVTPLVDVCLVLLIIFMVIAPLLTAGADVNLPITDHPFGLDDGARIELELLQDGSVRLSGREVTPGELVLRLRDASRVAPGAEIRVLADESLPYRDVRAAMRSAQAAGFSGLELATKRRKPQER